MKKTLTISRPVVIPKQLLWTNVSVVLSRKGCIDTLGYLPMLSDLVKAYSAYYHRSVGMAPNQVNSKNEKEVWHRMYGKCLSKKPQKGSLKEKDRVKLNKKLRPLKKVYLPSWTEKVFTVFRVIPRIFPSYKDWMEPWPRTPFYERDLQKVYLQDDDLFRVDKIVKRKGDKVLVRCKGWPDKYKSWIE